MRSYRPEELFDEHGALRRGARGARAARRAAHGREPARERRARAARPRPAGLPRLRGRRSDAGAELERGDARARHVAARRDAPQPGDVPHLRPGRDGVEPAGGGVRGDRPRVGGRARADRRPPRARRARDGGAQRAPLPGLARGLPAHRPPRPLQLLRGVHPHHRLDVQPAREVAEGHARHPVAPADRVAQLLAHVARVAPGPQRLLAPGPRLHRPRREQEGGDHPRLPAARREHAAVGGRPLPALAGLRQRHRRGQAAGARLPDDGRGDPPLHHAGSGSGSGRSNDGERRARRRAGVRRRHPHARDARRRAAAPRDTSPSSRCAS